jgi:hypothetical protein
MLGTPAHAEPINSIVIWKQGQLSQAFAASLAGVIAVAISAQTLPVLLPRQWGFDEFEGLSGIDFTPYR